MSSSEFFPTPFKMPGYLVAVSAPNSGIDEMSDGSWHVIAQVDNIGQGDAREKAQKMIPFVLGTGGDLVMYRMDEDPTVVMRRGGATSDAPAVADIRPYDPALADKLEAKRKRYAVDQMRRPPAPKEASRSHVHLAAGLTAAMLALLGGAGYWWSGRPAPAPPTERFSTVDLSERKLNALRQGAYEITEAVPGNPDMMQTVRYCPRPGSKDMRREIVATFPTYYYNEGKGYVPESMFEWCPGLPRLSEGKVEAKVTSLGEYTEDERYRDRMREIQRRGR